jgi:anti-sigma regulatory factor (Ser/Thr protein kinase)
MLVVEASWRRRELVEDLSLHILDIIENSIAAGATSIEVQIEERITENLLIIKIKDNGKGMDKKKLVKALDPFYTTKKTRSVGLGLSMLAQASQEADGSFDIKSKPGQGTQITAQFVYNHIDRKPLGNMAETIVACLVSLGPGTDLRYRHCKDNNEFVFDTNEIRKVLSGVAINDAEIISFLKQHIEEGLSAITKKEQ